MPTENKKDAPVDDRDAKIADLTQQVESLTNANATLTQELADAKAKKRGAPVPSGNYAVVDGKTIEIEKVVEAKYASDEARKGFIDMDAQLLVPKR